MGVILLASWVGACDAAAESDDVRRAGFVQSSLVSGNGEIVWGPCEDEELLMLGAVCGMLEVPLDHGRPNGEQIQLALSKLEHTVPDEQYLGAMQGEGADVLCEPLPLPEPGPPASEYAYGERSATTRHELRRILARHARP